MTDAILERARYWIRFVDTNGSPFISWPAGAMRELCTALLAADERARALAEALVKCRAHTGYLPTADRELLAGLLASIARICDAALQGDGARGQAKADGSGE